MLLMFNNASSLSSSFLYKELKVQILPESALGYGGHDSSAKERAVSEDTSCYKQFVRALTELDTCSISNKLA